MDSATFTPEKQHAPEDGAHAVRAEGRVGGHAGHPHAGIHLARVAHGVGLGHVGPHGLLTLDAAAGRIELHVVLAHQGLEHFHIVARAFYGMFAVKHKRVHVQAAQSPPGWS